jgi:hypothetical protein
MEIQVMIDTGRVITSKGVELHPHLIEPSPLEMGYKVAVAVDIVTDCAF